MSRLAVVCLALSGCILADPINQRPSLDIKQTSGEVVYRKDIVTLEAVAEDPEAHFVFFHFRAYLGSAACATDIGQCDSETFAEMSSDQFEFEVPSFRKPPNDMMPVELVRVVLQGQDAYGATANPPQELLIPIGDRPPTLRLFKASAYNDVVSTPVNIFAEVGDPDDGPMNPTLAWEVFTPTNQPLYDLVDITDIPDDNNTATVQYGKRFTARPNPQTGADGTGEFTIRVTATDSLGQQKTESIPVVVAADAPPCLRQLSPLVAVAPASLPMSEPTLFQVHVVKDDLDPYPTVNDTILGTTRFTWSLSRNGGPRQALTGVSGNSVGLDPAAYQPNDVLELRVEIYDRNNTMIPCADGLATCSIGADPMCLQRQTWRAEVR